MKKEFKLEPGEKVIDTSRKFSDIYPDIVISEVKRNEGVFFMIGLVILFLMWFVMYLVTLWIEGS